MGLRATPGGFGTPEYGDGQISRIEGRLLVQETGGNVATQAITTIRAASEFFGASYDVDWFTDFKDPLAAMDPDRPLKVEEAPAAALGSGSRSASRSSNTLRGHGRAEDEVSEVQTLARAFRRRPSRWAPRERRPVMGPHRGTAAISSPTSMFPPGRRSTGKSILERSQLQRRQSPLPLSSRPTTDPGGRRSFFWRDTASFTEVRARLCHSISATRPAGRGPDDADGLLVARSVATPRVGNLVWCGRGHRCGTAGSGLRPPCSEPSRADSRRLARSIARIMSKRSKSTWVTFVPFPSTTRPARAPGGDAIRGGVVGRCATNPCRPNRPRPRLQPRSLPLGSRLRRPETGRCCPRTRRGSSRALLGEIGSGPVRCSRHRSRSPRSGGRLRIAATAVVPDPMNGSRTRSSS